MHLVDDQVPATPEPLLVFDHTADETARTCADCGGVFRAHIVAARYDTAGLAPGDRLPAPDHICPTCLTAAGPLAQAVTALDVIAAAGLNERALDLVQQAISRIRRHAHQENLRVTLTEVFGPQHTEPAVVDLGHQELTDDAELYVSAELCGGQPRVKIVDSGGYPFADLDPDAAREMVQQISDLITTAETAARF